MFLNFFYRFWSIFVIQLSINLSQKWNHPQSLRKTQKRRTLVKPKQKDKQEKTEKMETDEKNTQPSSNGPNLDMEVD